MDEVLNTAYNKLRPRIQGVLDDKFGVAVRGMADPILKSGNPTKVDLFKEIQGALRVLKGGKYDGLSFKDADQKLRQLASDWSQVEAGPGITSPSTYHEMARVALKFKDQLRAQVSRNDPVVGAALKKLDKAWAHKLRIENASNRATATGVYSPQQLLTSLKMMDTSKGKGAFSRGKAFDQNYTQAAEDIIGSAPSKEHSNFLQTASMLYAMGRHPLAIGLPVSATAGANYTPGLKKIIEFLATSERPKGVEVMLRSQIPTILRKKYTENREKD